LSVWTWAILTPTLQAVFLQQSIFPKLVRSPFVSELSSIAVITDALYLNLFTPNLIQLEPSQSVSLRTFCRYPFNYLYVPAVVISLRYRYRIFSVTRKYSKIHFDCAFSVSPGNCLKKSGHFLANCSQVRSPYNMPCRHRGGDRGGWSPPCQGHFNPRKKAAVLIAQGAGRIPGPIRTSIKRISLTFSIEATKFYSL
jgi:hypothetical protein